MRASRCLIAAAALVASVCSAEAVAIPSRPPPTRTPKTQIPRPKPHATIERPKVEKPLAWEPIGGSKTGALEPSPPKPHATLKSGGPLAVPPAVAEASAVLERLRSVPVYVKAPTPSSPMELGLSSSIARRRAVALFGVVPTTAEAIGRVFPFGPKPSLAETLSLEMLALRLATSDRPTIRLVTRDAGRAEFAKFLSEVENEYAVVIGHNDGGWLRFPDGSAVHLAEAARACTKAHKLCVFLSCKSDLHLESSATTAIGIPTQISFHQAHTLQERVAKGIEDALSRGELVDWRVLQREVGLAVEAITGPTALAEIKYVNTQWSPEMRVGTVGAVAGLAIVAYYIVYGDDSKKGTPVHTPK